MRIGINIPKELHQRLQPLKGTINISQICREALEAHVTKYEASAEWLGSDEAKAIAVCHCEADLQRKAMVEIDWETVGYQDARDWAQAATLADWDYWNRCRNHPYRQSQNAIWAHGRHVRVSPTRGEFVSPGGARTFHERHREYFNRIAVEQDAEFMEWMDEEYDGLSPVYDFASAERDYGRGWIAYTSAVWEMIVQLRVEYRSKWERERMQSSLTRDEPDLPEHIREVIQRMS